MNAKFLKGLLTVALGAALAAVAEHLVRKAASASPRGTGRRTGRARKPRRTTPSVQTPPAQPQ